MTAPEIVRVLEMDDGTARVIVRLPGAMADGSDGQATVVLTTEQMRLHTPDALRRVIRAALTRAQTNAAELRGSALDGAVEETRDALENAAEESLADWQAWQWRLDNVANYPGWSGFTPAQQNALVTALTNRRDAAAARDLAILVRWRTAT